MGILMAVCAVCHQTHYGPKGLVDPLGQLARGALCRVCRRERFATYAGVELTQEDAVVPQAMKATILGRQHGTSSVEKGINITVCITQCPTTNTNTTRKTDILFRWESGHHGQVMQLRILASTLR